MPKVRLSTVSPVQRTRSVYDILGVPNTGASPTGSTFYKTLFTCPREFALKYIVGFSPVKVNDALSIGWLFHYLLETYYRQVMLYQKICTAGPTSEEFLFGGHKAAMLQTYKAFAPLADADGYKEIYDTAHRLITGYFERYDRLDRWRIIAVEETIIYQAGFGYSARLDLIVEDYDLGGMFIVEHKSTKMISADLLDSYQLDLQILGQKWLMQKCVDLKSLPPFKGVMINIGTKHKTPQYIRHNVDPSRLHLDAFVRSIRSWRQLKDVYAKLDWPQALGHCSGYARGYSKCQFYEICHGHPELSVADWLEAKDPPSGFVREQVKV